MLQVITPEEVLRLIRESFTPLSGLEETVGLDRALGRVLAGTFAPGEYVPGFDRSTVDGYAVRAADTFGCGEAVPAVLALAGQVAMGRGGGDALAPGAAGDSHRRRPPARGGLRGHGGVYRGLWGRHRGGAPSRCARPERDISGGRRVSRETGVPAGPAAGPSGHRAPWRPWGWYECRWPGGCG